MTDDTNSRTFAHGSFLRQKRRLLLPSSLLVLAIVVTIIIASSHEIAVSPVSSNGRIGSINPSGKVVVQPQFADAGLFEYRLALVLAGNTWAYVDNYDKLEINPQFGKAGEFSGWQYPRRV